MTKVIHVHLIFEKKDYYFGSISAIYTVLNDAQIGIKKSSLLHAGLTDGGVKITRRAIIKLFVAPKSNLTPNRTEKG